VAAKFQWRLTFALLTHGPSHYLRLKARRQGLAWSLGADGMVVRPGT
jgi:hypothetical protein